jgi:hypothetical protein
MKRRRLTLFFLAAVLVLACSCPLVGTSTGLPGATATATGPIGLPPSATAGALVPSQAPAGPNGPPVASPNGQPVNCRSGPGLNFPVVIVLSAGQTAEIVGKTADASWLQLKNPSVPGSFCWVSTSVVTATGNLGGIQIVAAPPAPTAPPTTEVTNVVVTSVSVSVSPTTIGVPGCIGPIQPSTASAAITVNGPIKLQWHFETEQNGALSIHGAIFTKAGTKDVSETFTPPVTPGTWSVQLFIEDMNLKGMDAVATYKISC